MRNVHVDTASVHAGRHIDPATGAVASPIHLSTTFEREADGSYPRGFAYTTFHNPNRAWLEEAMTELEGGAGAVATASGMGAVAATLSALRPGNRIIVSPDLFQGTARLLNDQACHWGIDVDIADMTNLEEVAAKIGPQTRMIWVDSPSNPLMRITDIAAVAEIARSRGMKLVVDATFATYVLQRSLDLGADVAVYAATKYISGHSDIVGGIAIFREQDELYDRARAFQINVGVTPSPFDCWMIHRGLRTLPLRMRAHCRNAEVLAQHLHEHPNVEVVFYPGLASAQGHEVARRQMPGGYGGMMSFVVKGDNHTALDVAARVRLFTRAASLGGVESLIEHRASSPIQTRSTGTGFVVPNNLLRLSVGIENVDDLICDLDNALDVKCLA